MACHLQPLDGCQPAVRVLAQLRTWEERGMRMPQVRLCGWAPVMPAIRTCQKQLTGQSADVGAN